MADAEPYAPLPPEDAAGRLQCLEWSNWYHSLAAHLRAGEDLSTREYRERHGLAVRHPLVSRELSDRWREQARAGHDRGERTVSPTGRLSSAGWCT